MQYETYSSKFDDEEFKNHFELSQENLDFLSDPAKSLFVTGESVSDESSPSVNSNPISIFDHIDRDNKGKKKTKKQLLEEQDAILLATDDSQLTEDQLQAKKKAQNRAAQRAFRERKETKMKELEMKLNQSESDKQRLMEELEAVRKKTFTIQTENELLRTRGSPSEIEFEFPKNEDDFISQILDGSNHQFNPENKDKVYPSPDNGKKVLALGAVWDYLLYRSDVDNLEIDVVEVMNKLKGNEKCHGYGPAYPVELIDQVILESSRS